MARTDDAVVKFSWKETPMAIRVAMICALLGFVARCSSTSSSTRNGRLTECTYVDGGALLFGGVTVVASLIGIAASLRRSEDKALMLGISIVTLLVGIVHLMRGTGTIGGACN